MPSTFNPEGFGIAKLIWTLAGDLEPMVCTFGFENGGDQSPDDCAAAIDARYQEDFVAGMLGSDWTYRGVEVQLGNPAGSGGPVGTATAAVVGIAGLLTMPQNVAGLCHKRTAVGGRRGRGRFYLPGGFLPENVVSPAGAISSSLITSVNGVLENFRAELATDLVPMALLHVQAAPIVPPYAITSLALDPIIATQRTRLRR